MSPTRASSIFCLFFFMIWSLSNSEQIFQFWIEDHKLGQTRLSVSAVPRQMFTWRRPATADWKHRLFRSPWWGRSWSPPVWGPPHPPAAPSWPRCGCRSCRSRTRSPTLAKRKVKVSANPGITSQTRDPSSFFCCLRNPPAQHALFIWLLKTSKHFYRKPTAARYSSGSGSRQ